ncbi:MAG: hypothetical protein KAT39_12845 [Alphaproteobacteria bacterium]|nr:hypothetical protein [Alphaproteobacteria bacterium]
MRHLHDLAELSDLVHDQASFRELAVELLDADAGRIQNAPEWIERSSKERLVQALEVLELDGDYRDDYEKFVLALSYARDEERTGYDEALAALRSLADAIFR